VDAKSPAAAVTLGHVRALIEIIPVDATVLITR
jgi:hypothetical protein